MLYEVLYECGTKAICASGGFKGKGDEVQTERCRPLVWAGKLKVFGKHYRTKGS